MMLRFRLFIAMMALMGTVFSQSPPPPPPPPPPPSPIDHWDPPTVEEQEHTMTSVALTLDELLFHEQRFAVKDDVYREAPDSNRSQCGLKMAFLVGRYKDSMFMPPVRNYTWYNRDGKVSQTAMRWSLSDDSLIHKWKYDSEGKVICYIILEAHLSEGSPSKPSMDGDSMVLKYTAFGSIESINRYAVIHSRGTRTASFVSKDIFTYNTNRTLASTSSGDVHYYYSYDANLHPIRIENNYSSRKRSPFFDSLAWTFSEVNDTIVHWFVNSESKIRVKIDRIVINRSSQLHLNYTLYGEEKFNYIRKIYGPISVACEYDVANRLVRKTIKNLNGILLRETAFEYARDGWPQAYYSLDPYFPAEDAGLPPSASAYPNSLYESTKLTYVLSPESREVPVSLSLVRALVGIKNEGRATLVTKNGEMDVIIVRQYY